MAKSQKKISNPINQSEASQKSATDFGEASRSAKRIRKAFATFVDWYGEHDFNNRLNKAVIETLSAIPPSDAGARKFADGHLRLLSGFRFNPLQKLENLWTFPLAIDLKPAGLTFKLSKFHSPPVKNATDVVFQLMVANLDVVGETDETVKAKNLIIAVDHKFKPLQLNIPLNLEGDRALFIAVGVHHLNEGIMMTDLRSFACNIVYAERIKEGQVVDFRFKEEITTAIKELEDDGIEWESTDES